MKSNKSRKPNHAKRYLSLISSGQSCTSFDKELSFVNKTLNHPRRLNTILSSASSSSREMTAPCKLRKSTIRSFPSLHLTVVSTVQELLKGNITLAL